MKKLMSTLLAVLLLALPVTAAAQQLIEQNSLYATADNAVATVTINEPLQTGNIVIKSIQAGYDTAVAGVITVTEDNHGTASSATTDTAGYAVGVSTVTLASAGTGDIRAGDEITFTGDTQVYRVTSGDTDVSNGGSVSFTPALQTAIAGSATAITLDAGTDAVIAVIPFASALDFFRDFGDGIVVSEGKNVTVALSAQGTGGQFGHLTVTYEQKDLQGS